MMRNICFTTLLLGLGLSGTIYGGVMFTSPYGGQNPGNLRDQLGVIGLLADFDIQSLDFTNVTPGNITAEIRFNYDGGDASLSPFSIDGISLRPGDLLFSSGGQMWGVALASHNGFIAGDLYSVDAFRTASQVLGNPNANYRPSQDVWMANNGHQMIVGTGTSNTVNVGGDEVMTTLSFTPGAGFLTAFQNGMTVQFGNATCGNDVIIGNTVPEPVSTALLGSGLIGLWLVGRRRATRTRS